MAMLSTARRERFARLVAAGVELGEAYRGAGYRVKCGGKPRQRVLARRLLAIPEVVARVEALAEETRTGLAAEPRALWGGLEPLDWALARLVETVDRALQNVAVCDRRGVATGEYRFDGTLAVRAVELACRLLGLLDPRRAPARAPADPYEGVSDAELEDRVRRLYAELGLGGP